MLLALVALTFAEETQVSKKEMYYRARDVLKESLESGDMARAGEAFDYLKANVENGAPLNHFEEYLIYSEMGRYDEAIAKYATLRRIILDSNYVSNIDTRISVEDYLNNYLYRGLEPFTKDVMDSLNNRVQQSNASDENKGLFAALLYGDQVVSVRVRSFGDRSYVFRVINDTTCAEIFLRNATDFVQKYPNSEHAKYLNDQTIPFVQNYMDKQREFRANPLKYKFYTGGFGAYYSKWWGGITGDATDYISMDMDSYMLELELQFWRVNLGAFVAYGIEGKRKYRRDLFYQGSDYDDGYSIGFTAGFDAFDSKYVKVVPFIGIGATTIDALEIDAHNHFLLGTNVDLRLWTSKASRRDSPIASVQVRLKYMAKFSSYSDTYWNVEQIYDDETGYFIESEKHQFTASGDYVNHAFSIGLGLYWW